MQAISYLVPKPIHDIWECYQTICTPSAANKDQKWVRGNDKDRACIRLIERVIQVALGIMMGVILVPYFMTRKSSFFITAAIQACMLAVSLPSYYIANGIAAGFLGTASLIDSVASASMKSFVLSCTTLAMSLVILRLMPDNLCFGFLEGKIHQFANDRSQQVYNFLVPKAAL